MSDTAIALPRKHPLSVADYHRMGEAGILHEDSRVELIEGEIIDMTPIGSKHAGLVRRMHRILDLMVREHAIVSVQNPIVLGEHSEPEPDIALLRLRDDSYMSAHPRPEDTLLIIEVADDSLRYDREVKVPLYATHQVPEVWLVDANAKTLTLFRQPQQGAYQTVVNPRSLQAIAPTCLPELALDLSGLFV